MRTAAKTVLLLAVLGSLVTACASAPTDPASSCDQAVAQATAIDPASDTVNAMDGAIAGCESLEAWVAAAQQFPDAFGGQDPGDLARERCGASAALANTPVCTDLLGN